MTASHLLKLQLLTAAALVVLAASCGGTRGTAALQTPEDMCDLSSTGANEAGDRLRAWVLFRVDDPRLAADQFTMPDEKGETPLKAGGNDYVIVRADVVEGNGDFNLVVPLDAANTDQFAIACGRLIEVVGQPPKTVLRVLEHVPTPPHEAHSYLSAKELEAFPIPTEFPEAGRYPKSPGANPWG